MKKKIELRPKSSFKQATNQSISEKMSDDASEKSQQHWADRVRINSLN
jgi:hypothetical protein